MKTRTCVADLESNGLLNQANRIWCGVVIDADTEQERRFYPHQIDELIEFIKEEVKVLVIHNGLGFDVPLLKKLKGFDPSEYGTLVVDTLLMSRLQRPERRLPYNCPNKKAGPHSIEAWGYRVGRGKPEHDDWGQFSEAMLHRCSEDTRILLLVYKALLLEGGPSWRRAHQLTHKLFDKVLYKQEEHGWLMDRDFIDKSINLLTRWMNKIDSSVLPRLPPVVEVKENKSKGVYGYIKKPFLKSGAYSAASRDWLIEDGINPDYSNRIAGCFSRVGFRSVNLNSNPEVKDLLIREGWVPSKWNYKKDPNGGFKKDGDGNLIKTSPKLDSDDPFIGVEGGVGRLIAKRVQCRHRRSQLEGWLRDLDDDGRLRQRIGGIATTSRLKHRVLVNVPGDAFFGKYMRRCFISKPGYLLVGVDVAGCQARMLASRIGDKNYTETIINGDKNKGTSIHQLNQAEISKQGVDVTYKVAKNLQYGFLFGAQDPKLGAMVGGGASEGAAIRRGLLRVSPGFQELVDNITQEWEANAKTRRTKYGIEHYDGWITGLDGRPVFIKHRHTILVFLLQSDEAILVQTASVLLAGRLADMGWTHGIDYGFCGCAHDEWTAEVREDLAVTYKELAEDCIVQAGIDLHINCPQEGEGGIGNTWYDIH